MIGALVVLTTQGRIDRNSRRKGGRFSAQHRSTARQSPARAVDSARVEAADNISATRTERRLRKTFFSNHRHSTAKEQLTINV